MVQYTIQIICSSTRCWKCRRGEENFRQVIQRRQLNAEIVYITDIEEMIKFPTPFVPSFFVNGRLVSRGLIPPVEIIEKFFDYLDKEKSKSCV